MGFLESRIEMISKAAKDGYDISGRRSGKSLAGVFGMLSYCMKNPEKEYSIGDHYDNSPRNIRFNILPQFRVVINSMDLEGFYIKMEDQGNHYTLIYSLDPLFKLKNEGFKEI